MLVYNSSLNEVLIFTVSNNLPCNGWFQQCLLCDTITAQKYLFKIDDEKHFYYFRCSPCKKKIISYDLKRDVERWLKKQCRKYEYKLNKK